MMRRTWLPLLVLTLTFMGLFTSTARAQGQDDISSHRECTECGMDRKAYGFSRMLVVFADGKEVGVCSLHCAITVTDRNKEKKVKALLVADRNTHDLILAEKAIWVLGGKKRGVMTMRAKWAFTTPDAAQSFIDEYGGTIVPWEDALAAARTDAMPKTK
jgi:nitrous oxide reductase accessory protein NosL